jgi:Kyakuja-Dileera-Zisupton transposase
MVEALLDAFGLKIGGGYDIGCKFGIILTRSPLRSRAKALQYQALVGSFHGHAHNRLCQLHFLATYVKGMGLEVLEGGERYFSKPNALASSVRHTSVFHHKQKIVEFAKHMDQNKTYQSLSE